ncbi:MAG: hypothetical protein A2898_05560 [Candidatus Kerfeldbacteria bacterium RIFCSPLOWO2_01_FULL_48_11]|uniref:HD domain-containing protein n=1 Tax=Candidatus Kerfeldbacteria bacterium RIFCSPLOWO2_01_FULL_48_11 TaxID=1798543 RepID=A0A1G2AZV0_9BACT|nr:MAG: HD domain protein [Parcubacteria group bacterium GW2011_GWA2_48_9]KKW16745.1 MAG: HD domain protein [Parcubacteria group bacterium GW2011_GWC2_49_9]OGY82471.1 MAG: hypothetical protein A2898_05560 [Candidatus Kerfeldbacteria bacterium RIFCSPLOWO2_01_FULL_48_11]HCJ52274.1 hypothetical protein [Candidatus Kerfeldbacteria bacterium]HCM68691.1 hypothetical protein [Candidatus Kerfeldbacteria bacterium]
MSQKRLIAKFIAINKHLYAESKNPLSTHGPEHHMRVCKNALKLARKYPVDKDVLIPACFLHDIGAYYPDVAKDKYHEEDTKRTVKTLKRIKLSDEKKRRIVEAVAKHGSDPKYRRKSEPIEITILRDADKMEAFGPIGVARIIAVRTLRGDTLQKIVRDFYTRGHLKQKWDAITLPEARKLAKKDYQYSMKFFEDLSKIQLLNT